MMGGELPQTTGREVAGTVDEVGKAVEDVSVGDPVFGFAAQGAGAAELSLVGPYFPIPPALTFVQAASLPVAVETAARTLDLLGVRSGTSLLVNGAAGAVGSAAVQLAVARGARVIGTASQSNHEYLRTLGAQATAYGDGLAERVRELAPRGVDCALDAFGGGALPELVSVTGSPEQVVTIADHQGARETGTRFSGGVGTDRALYALSEIGELIESDEFSLPVQATFPLARIGEAHELSQAGHVRGKLVLVVG
jgi:NADPH:quinone reductase-like Zn-dependent oxidoreductase